MHFTWILVRAEYIIHLYTCTMYIFTFFICKYCIHVIIDPDRRNLSNGSTRFSRLFGLNTIYISSQMMIRNVAKRVEPNFRTQLLRRF